MVGWRKSGLDLKREDGRRCSTMREVCEGVDDTYICGCLSATRPSLLGSCVVFGPPSCTLVAYHVGRSGMPLHDAILLNYNKGATTDIKAHVPSIWA